MKENSNAAVIVAALIVGVCILLGVSSAGYFIGKGGTRFKSESRTVTVKGLVEQIVKADQSVWVLRFRRAGSDIGDIHSKISADRDAVVAFLKEQGFTDEEISRQPIHTIDKWAREYDQSQTERYRYLVTGSVVVTTANVDQVAKVLGETERLLKSGVVLDGQYEGSANPRYTITKFNELRPQLLAEATKNARLTARQFASDSGVSVGRIRSANQGNIQIFGTDGNDESAPYSPTSTPVKKIRVVSTFEFELQ
jgi:hypothetical protein